METLGGQDVHVWFAAPDHMLPDSSVVADCLALLDADEEKRYRVFEFDRDRHCFLAAHALLRMALSRCAPVDPREWVFDTNEYGRPAIAGPSGACRFKFSLSHTNGMVACAICQHAEVGVDVETVSPETPAIRFCKNFDDTSEPWRFVLKRLQSRHRLALAVRRIDVAEMVCRIQPAEWV